MVNVNNYDEQVPEGDMLSTIFDRQQDLMLRYHPIEEENMGHQIPSSYIGKGLDLHDRHAQVYIKDFAWRITEELGEAMNTLKNKPWKQTHMTTDEVHFLEEMVDAFHFMIELLIMVGFTPETLTKTYLNKNAVNQFRIASKY